MKTIKTIIGHLRQLEANNEKIRLVYTKVRNGKAVTRMTMVRGVWESNKGFIIGDFIIPKKCLMPSMGQKQQYYSWLDDLSENGSTLHLIEDIGV